TWVLRVSDRKRAMRVIVEERAPRLTQVQVNAGLFGPRAVAELILKRIIADVGVADEAPAPPADEQNGDGHRPAARDAVDQPTPTSSRSTSARGFGVGAGVGVCMTKPSSV